MPCEWRMREGNDKRERENRIVSRSRIKREEEELQEQENHFQRGGLSSL